ncbi:MAG: P-loop NTPase [Bacteroidota bacterium]
MMKATPLHTSFIATVLSGKGGAGKSMATINTATMLTDFGYNVAIIDADLGLSNCATLLGQQVPHTVSHWIDGSCTLDQVMTQHHGVTLVTCANDPAQNKYAADIFMDALDQIIGYLKIRHDFILIDTPAGAVEMTFWALDASDIGVLMLIDEPTAVSDVYRLCKYVYSIDPTYIFSAIVNFAESDEAAKNTFQRFNNILDYFLKKEAQYFGFIPASTDVKQSVIQQQTLLESGAGDHIVHEIEFIAQNMIAYAATQPTLTPQYVQKQ